MAVILVGTGLLLVAGGCGLGLTYDSHIYISISRDFSQEGFISGLQNPLLQGKPPLYPWLLSIFSRQHALLLPIISYIISVLASWYLASRCISSLRYRIFYALLLLFGTPFFAVHGFAWSEPPFIAVFSLLLAALYRYEKQPGLLLLVGMGGLAGLLLGLRHAGIFMVVGLLVSFLLFRSPFATQARLILTLVVCLFGAWFLFKPEGFSERWSTMTAPLVDLSAERYVRNAASFANGFSLWIMPYPVPLLVRTTFLLLLIGWLMYRYRHLSQSLSPFWKYVLVTFAVYYVGIHTAFTLEYRSSDAERYLSPFYPALLIFALSILEKQNRHQKLMIAGLFIFSLYPLSRTIKNVNFWHHQRCAERTTEAVSLNHSPAQKLSKYEISQ